MLDSKETVQAVKNEVSDRIYDFVLVKPDVEIVTGWLDGNRPEGISLSKLHRQAILVAICRSTDFGLEYKNTMIQKIIGDQVDDLSLTAKLTCEAAEPDRDQKLKIWHQLSGIDVGNSTAQKFSLTQLRAKLQGLFQWNQEDILEPVYNDYFDVIQDKRFYQKQSFKFAEHFVVGLLPTARQVTQAHVDKLKQIKDTLPGKDPQLPLFYKKILSDASEKLERILRLRGAAIQQLNEKK